jgi:hypothetical protein
MLPTLPRFYDAQSPSLAMTEAAGQSARGPCQACTLKQPFGIFLIAIFFALATCILVGVGTALLFPGSAVEAVWRLYPERRALLMPYRHWLAPGFLMLAVAMASASIGCFRLRKWGWWLAVAIFAVNGLGDLMQLVLGHFVEGGIGVAAAGLILFYLSRRKVRAAMSAA